MCQCQISQIPGDPGSREPTALGTISGVRGPVTAEAIGIGMGGGSAAFSSRAASYHRLLVLSFRF